MIELVAPPGEEELSAIVLEAPPMRGLEYLDAGALRAAWFELDARVRLEVSAHSSIHGDTVRLPVRSSR